MAKPGVITLTLRQDGTSLSGVITSPVLYQVDVSGTVGLDGRVTLAGERRGHTFCFDFPSPNIELLSSLDQWSAALTKTGVLSGSFRQSVLTGIGLCRGRSMYAYTTQAPSIRRDAVVKVFTGQS